MPKIEPKLTNRKDGRAVVHWKGKMHVMGKAGTTEAQKPITDFVSNYTIVHQGFRQKVICQKYPNWSWLEFAKKLSFPSL